MSQTFDPSLKRQIRAARGKFAAMAGAYCLGVFNDGFFRQSAMLLAVAAGLPTMQGHVMSVFALPYLLFAAPCGWLADRFSKGAVVILAKALEVAAMLAGAAGVVTGSWPLIIVMVFLMGWQSAIFGPALNGSIPELYPPVYVTRANAILKAVVTAAILGGVAACGVALEPKAPGWWGVPVGRLIVAAVVVGVAALGLAVSFGVPRRPAAAPRAKFPWTAPADTFRQLRAIRRDPLLAVSVITTVLVYFIGAVVIQLINKLGKNQLGRGEAVTSYLMAAELVGVAAGGAIAGVLAGGRRWRRLLAPAAAGMAAGMALVAAVPALPARWQLGSLFVLLAVTGLGGGMMLIPCEAFIQVRPEAGRKGAVLAAANFPVFAGIVLSGPAANLLTAHLRLRPSTGFAVMGAVALLMAAALAVDLRTKVTE